MSDRIGQFARAAGRWIPDATAAAVLMLFTLGAAALALGDGPGEVVDAWYRGLWMLLPFSMQMTLILLLSSVLSATPGFQRGVLLLARLPKNATQVIALSVLLSAAASYLYWGLGLTLGPLIALHFSRAAEERGVAIDFPFLLALQLAANSVWQFGLSSSAPLLVATPGHFLEATTGVMRLGSTIGSPGALLVVLLYPLALIALARALMPRDVQPLSAFPASARLTELLPAAAAEPEPPSGFSGWSERSALFPLLLVAALCGWLFHHFVTRGASLDFNAMNTLLLALTLALNRSLASFSAALRKGILSCWPIVVLYQLYGGVAGVLQDTAVGPWLAGWVASAATPASFPLLTALAGTLVAVFVPSSGGQWIVQGFVTVKAAAAVGASAQQGLLALGIGDQMGNLISPFWVVVVAGIAQLDFRRIYGYGLVFAGLWFVLGVAIFSWLPAHAP